MGLSAYKKEFPTSTTKLDSQHAILRTPWPSWLMMLLAFLLFTRPAGAADFSFNTYMVADGLSDNTVYCGLRDSYGFAWFGTANGLNCYDGTTNTIYRNMVDEDLPYGNNIIVSIMEHENDIWVGGPYGLYIYHRNGNNFSRFNVKTKYGVQISCTVQKLFCARNGLIWICTLGQGVFIYSPKDGKLTQNSRFGGFVCDVCQDGKGNIYLATITGNVAIFSEQGQFRKSFSIPGYTNDKNPVSLACIGSVVWIGTDTGLYKIEAGTDTIKLHKQGRTQQTINTILATKDRELLLGTSKGLYLLDTETNEYSRIDTYGKIKGISDQAVNALYLDNDNTLWVMTNMGGVNYVSKRKERIGYVQLPDLEQGEKVYVLTFCHARDGNVWLGTTNGPYSFNTTTMQVKHIGAEELAVPITAMLTDGDYLWLGTNSSGMRRLNLNTGETKSYVYSESQPYTLPSNEVRSIYKNRDGKMFVATSWGLCRFDKATGRFMGYSHLSAMTDFVDLREDGNGALWAATSGRGVYCYTPGQNQWTSFENDMNDARSLSSNTIVALASNHHGEIYFCTKGGGLCRYNGDGTFLRIGQADNDICFALEDKNQDMWMASETEIMCLPHRNKSTILHMAGQNDLLHGKPIYRSAIYAENGYLLFGTENGFYYFHPAQLSSGMEISPVYIVAVSLPYVKDSKRELERLGLNRPLYTMQDMTLPYADNSFTLHFSAPAFGLAHAVRYEYMLKGYDKQWAVGTKNAEATYANVPPGEYVFMLREAGATDAKDVSSIKITVLPPWYLTWYAYVVYVLAFLTFIALIYQRARSVLRSRYDTQMKEYRIEQEKRNFESKINFFVNLVHEIRTPLSLISLPLECMESREHGPEDTKYISIIRQNMNYLLGITTQLLDFQKVENGSISLHKERCSVKAFMQEVYAQFATFVEVDGKTIQLELTEEDIYTDMDRSCIRKIMTNLMSNALKYSHSRIVMSMQCSADKRFVELHVSDDGPGIPDADKERIFDTFYQVDKDRIASMKGTGIGLAYAKALALAHGGRITVTDAPRSGSHFTLFLPIEQNLEAADTTRTGQRQMKEVHDTLHDEEGNEVEMADNGGTPFTLLIVEDNHDLLNLTAQTLSAWYRVVKARNGAEAMQVLLRTEVDVIISDVMMPVMDGLELCGRIKNDINYSHIPIILLTAKITMEAKVEGLKSGADAYVEKPFSIQQLHIQIENLLRLRQNFHKRMSTLNGNLKMIQPSDYGISQQNVVFIEKVQSVLDENIADEDFSIETLAEQTNMSRSSFYRKLKSITGLSPVDFLKQQRMMKAEQLIREGLSISEVATRVGFTSASYFTKCFKQQFGVLPKDYHPEP